MASIYHLNHPFNWFEGNLFTSPERDPLLDAFIDSFSDPSFARCGPRPHHRPSTFWGSRGSDHPGHQNPHQSPFGGGGNPLQGGGPFHPSFFWSWGKPTQEDGANTPQASQNPGQPREATSGPSNESPKTPAQDAKLPAENKTENEWRYRCERGKHSARDCQGKGKETDGKGEHSPHRAHDFHSGGDARAGSRKPPFGGWDAHHESQERGTHHRGPQPFGAPFLDFLRNVAENHGARFKPPTPEGIDFIPAIDVFDTPDKYIVHASLPGAKKEDLSIDYDFEESVLRFAGVVYRPGLNEDLHQALAVEERAREVGVFEREVRFETRGASVVVDVDGITAKLEDGILNVTVPKVIKEPSPNKKVFIQEDAPGDNNVRASVTVTPGESEKSDSEEDGDEYIKLPV